MKKIRVNASKGYEVIIGRNLIENLGEHIYNHLNYDLSINYKRKICIVTDSNVAPLYLGKIVSSLKNIATNQEAYDFEVYHFIFSAGEASKNLSTINDIVEFLAEKEFTRNDLLLALGGGITGDITGFAAATYLRGISFIQIPTTLLAAVDSSVGGKTGVNLAHGKNLIGAFWQPDLVICDCNTFSTLSKDIFLDGIAEAIKYGVIFDKKLFEEITESQLYTQISDSKIFIDRIFSGKKKLSEMSFSKDFYDNYSNIKPGLTIEDLVFQCVKIKSNIVEQDEKEMGLRKLLNFGHTIGHSIEKNSNYSISHGHAVAIGMLIASKGAYQLGLTSQDCSLTIKEALIFQGFQLECPYTAQSLAKVALNDKKRDGNNIVLIIPEKLGKCILAPLEISKLTEFISLGLDY